MVINFLEYIHVHIYNRLYGFLSEVVKCKTQKNKLSLCCFESGSGAEPGKQGLSLAIILSEECLNQNGHSYSRAEKKNLINSSLMFARKLHSDIKLMFDTG